MRDLVVGDNVYVIDPQGLVAGCVSITGNVVSLHETLSGVWVTLSGEVAKAGNGWHIVVSLPVRAVNRRLGTPISELSGRPGHPGYARFKAIAESWGHE